VAKMVANKFKNQNHAQPMRRCQMPRIFFFWKAGGRGGVNFFLKKNWVNGVASIFFFILGHG